MRDGGSVRCNPLIAGAKHNWDVPGHPPPFQNGALWGTHLGGLVLLCACCLHRGLPNGVDGHVGGAGAHLDVGGGALQPLPQDVELGVLPQGRPQDGLHRGPLAVLAPAPGPHVDLQVLPVGEHRAQGAHLAKVLCGGREQEAKGGGWVITGSRLSHLRLRGPLPEDRNNPGTIPLPFTCFPAGCLPVYPITTPPPEQHRGGREATYSARDGCAPG